ncbi:MAG TPA: acyl-CoA dehydrogenase family protein [Hyphomonadaceae bacterium]|nr:acyl-CoA dehydrogenase family protein [Hyphomonadaceae bacterium]HPI50417.1 acyl-CoA dehydrogenase family protein [Hyphomonadaceae bacterium]
MILTEAQNMVSSAVREMARVTISPNAGRWEAERAYPPELFPALGKLGLFGMTAPAAYGGAEADYVSYTLALEELAYADGGLSTIVSIQNALVIAALLREGNDSQKNRFLPPLCSGEMIGAFALTEPAAGSDASALHTRAQRTADGYVLNGAKQFISSGKIAGLTIVFAATDPSAGKKGLTAFLVPAGRPGFLVGAREKKLGQLAADTCSLTFDDVLVEDGLRLGREGDGYRIALSNLEAGRIGIAAQCIGMARAALNIAISYAKERCTFGKRIIEHQAVGFRLADAAARLEAARQLVLHAAALKDVGAPCLKEASMAKLVASETAEAVCSASLQTLGGYGYLEDYGIAKIYRDVRVCQIYEGTSDILRMVIARQL